MLAMAVLPAALSYGAATPAVSTAKDFEAADPRDLPKMVSDILKALPTNPLDKDRKAREIIADFQTRGAGIYSKSAEVRLNSAILIAGLDTLSADFGLMKMIDSTNSDPALKIDDPSVRYYGAKGLAQIAPTLLKAPASVPRVVTALKNAAKAEKSPIVQQELFKALVAYEAGDALVEATDAIVAQMQTTAPDVGTVQNLARAFSVMHSKPSSISSESKAKLPATAVNAASYALQHLKAQLKAGDEGKQVPPELTAATLKLIVDATTAAGKPIQAGIIEEAELNMNGTFGTPGGAAKTPGIPAPGVIKAGG
jgi:hypothetical protein